MTDSNGSHRKMELQDNTEALLKILRSRLQTGNEKLIVAGKSLFFPKESLLNIGRSFGTQEIAQSHQRHIWCGTRSRFTQGYALGRNGVSDKRLVALGPATCFEYEQ